jgi:DNA-directed RNA polymerase subunit RPC12/RpoP
LSDRIWAEVKDVYPMLTLKCARCGRDFEALRQRKVAHCRECAEELRRKGEGPIQSKRRESVASGTYKWSDWHPLNKQVVRQIVPDKPGVYQVRWKGSMVPRFRGSSGVLYIGQAKGLRGRILQMLTLGAPHIANVPIDWAIKNSYHLEFRWVQNDSPRQLEKELLREYQREHIDTPPFNRVGVPWQEIMPIGQP